MTDEPACSIFGGKLPASCLITSQQPGGPLFPVASVMVLHKVWTWKYEPFQLGPMGGKPCQRPVVTNVGCTGPYDLGQGFVGYLAEAPDGTTVVIEDESCGIVGSEIEEVRGDVARATAEEMREQIKEARGFGERAEMLTVDEFWMLYSRR